VAAIVKVRRLVIGKPDSSVVRSTSAYRSKVASFGKQSDFAHEFLKTGCAAARRASNEHRAAIRSVKVREWTFYPG
jgi:hypothetical protein